MSSHIEIAGRRIGRGEPVYMVAELSANHLQKFDQAVELVHAAHSCGADAVKLQTYTADTLTIDSTTSHFQITEGSLWAGRILYDLYREAFTPWEWQPKLKDIANSLGMDCFSTPFDDSSVDFLEQMDVPAYKIASFELVDLALIRKVAATRKPLILSTGMATLAEIGEAVASAKAAGDGGLALLKCSSAYPAPPGEMNLRTIPDLIEIFDVPAGLSDHTLGIAVPIAAVTLGASIIEKHLTLSRAVPGPDGPFSLEPHEFKAMVDGVRTVERALGSVCYGASASEEKSRMFRRSLFVTSDMLAGEPLTPANLRSIRPAYGLAPKFYDDVLGRSVKVAVERGTPLHWDLLA